MKKAIGVIIPCPHCGKSHLATLKDAKLVEVEVDERGIPAMVVVDENKSDTWFGLEPPSNKT